MKRVLALLMATLMICAAFTGCGEKAETELGTITTEIYKSGLRYAEAMLQQSYGLAFSQYLDMEMGDGTTGADFIKKNTEAMFREFESVKTLAKENGIKFTDEDKKELDKNKKEMIKQRGGEKAFKEQLEAKGMTEAFFDYVSHAQKLYQKVYEELFVGEGKYALDAEEILQKATDGGYVRVKHVLVQTTADAEDFETKKALANDIAAKATAGEDFDSLIATYGEDPGMESYKHGYIIDQNGYTVDGQSQMMQEFTSASIALAVGGVSAPVQTSHGFHIIKRYPIDIESINADFEAFSNEFSQLAVTEVLNEYLEKTTPEFPKGYDKIDLHEVFGVEETEEAAPAGDAAEGGIEVGTAEPVAPEVTVEPAVPEVTEAPAAE